MRFKMMALVAATTFSLPALAQTEPAAPAPVKEKKICRRMEVTGSFIGSKAVCHTKAEWASIDSANAKASEDSMQRQRDAQPKGNRDF